MTDQPHLVQYTFDALGSRKTRPASIDAVRQILGIAADLIDTRGHAKGIFATNDGRLCTLGAIRQAGIALDMSPYETTLAAGALRGYLITDFGGAITVAQWNDMEERSKENVVATLRVVAHKFSS